MFRVDTDWYGAIIFQSFFFFSMEAGVVEAPPSLSCLLFDFLLRLLMQKLSVYLQTPLTAQEEALCAHCPSSPLCF